MHSDLAYSTLLMSVAGRLTPVIESVVILIPVDESAVLD